MKILTCQIDTVSLDDNSTVMMILKNVRKDMEIARLNEQVRIRSEEVVHDDHDRMKNEVCYNKGSKGAGSKECELCHEFVTRGKEYKNHRQACQRRMHRKKCPICGSTFQAVYYKSSQHENNCQKKNPPPSPL